jgi:peroxiredoxin Q/BCP
MPRERQGHPIGGELMAKTVSAKKAGTKKASAAKTTPKAKAPAAAKAKKPAAKAKAAAKAPAKKAATKPATKKPAPKKPAATKSPVKKAAPAAKTTRTPAAKAKAAAKPKTAPKAPAMTASTLPSVGQKAPAFSLPADDGSSISPASQGKSAVVLYFYPKDDTPGCTLEGHEFTLAQPEFKKEKTIILGVSRDDLKSHEKFKEKLCFTFELISDEHEELCKLFDVIKLKNMYGKEVLGIERSTFLIDKEGVLRQEWRKVKPEGHAEAVLFAVKQLNR